MDGLRHLRLVDAVLQAVLRIGVDAVGALHGMGHGQGDQRLFALRQLALFEHGSI